MRASLPAAIGLALGAGALGAENLGAGALCALPLAALLAARYAILHRGMDRAARRSFLLRSAPLCAATATAGALAAAAGDRLALPALPALLLGLAGLALLSRAFRRG